MRIIGDVHGKVDNYFRIIDSCDESICVGDFGFKHEWDQHRNRLGGESKHKIVMGNHDYLPYLYCGASCGDYGVYSDIFTVRGAMSIDKRFRVEGIDWFANEELTYLEGISMLEQYETVRPSIMVTHDCPQFIMEHLFGYQTKSITRQLLQEAFALHIPNIWVFGHHHRHKDEMIDGTRFICLDELGWIDL